jgi:hypothetical protein
MSGTIYPLQGGQQIQRWFLGLEQSSERQISAEETIALRKRVLKLKMRPVWIIAAAVCSISLFTLLLESLHLESDVPEILLSILAISLILIGLPIYLLFIRDSFREVTALKGDLNIGRAFIFEGPVTEPLRRIKTIQQLAGERLIHAGEDTSQRFDILPNSMTVIRVNGVMSSGWHKGRMLEATAPPEHHYDALVKEGLPENVTGSSFDLFQRHMSQAEISELNTHIAQFKKPSGLLIAMAVSMLLLIAAFIWAVCEGKFRQWQNMHQLEAAMITVLFAITAGRYIRSFKTARLMDRDAGVKILRIIKPQEECEGKTNSNLTPVLEFLPVSLLGWNVDGRPYPWRLKKPRILKI